MATILFANNESDFHRSYDTSPLLSFINGRPIICWIIGDILKYTEDNIYVIIKCTDFNLLQFCKKHYNSNPRINIYPESTCQNNLITITNILECRAANCHDEPLRLILCNSYILDFDYCNYDVIYYADIGGGDDKLSCKISDNQNNNLISASPVRYQFSSSDLFKKAISKSSISKAVTIDKIITEYNRKRLLRRKDIPLSKLIDFTTNIGIANGKRLLMESREFNKLYLDPVLPIITKRSSDCFKIECEYKWYANLPDELKSLVPRVISYKSDEITMEFYGYATLVRYFLYYQWDHNFWSEALNKLFNLSKLFMTWMPPEIIDLKPLYYKKTIDRINRLFEYPLLKAIMDLDTIIINGTRLEGYKSLSDQIQKSCLKLCNNSRPCIMHGDLCFNNILYDAESGIVKLIDPRGNIDGHPSIFGDPRYDIAKLRHSFCGNYDALVEGNFYIKPISENEWEFKAPIDHQAERDLMFDDLCLKYGFNPREIKIIEALLFLTMPPLHSESPQKQIAFLFTAIQKLNDVFHNY